ncbi:MULTISPECIES: hypothetical protein [unclassified Paenibacillus]|uniref:hypothetical protein n=1 Tax=unclassified Paenibacillus TaxID=185978 RepID=UPI001B3E2730|nr:MULTISPECIES: hypothetical protein [unclassified Paenibacillus]MBP1153671.1 hypothetical protein [Paenibacillus sp. PvP091]MBP1170944.1 hypothetical protein [Paenibacillus sp. PvR098]MBP2441972.1 hypothetical protein [Paenibacillus sp. PvP052]
MAIVRRISAQGFDAVRNSTFRPAACTSANHSIAQIGQVVLSCPPLKTTIE